MSFHSVLLHKDLAVWKVGVPVQEFQDRLFEGLVTNLSEAKRCEMVASRGCAAQSVSPCWLTPHHISSHVIPFLCPLQDPDDTLKRKTLELLYKMTGPANVEVIVEHMLTYLRSLQTSDAHAHGRADLASRLVELAERYAPNNQWFIQVCAIPV